VLRRKVRAALIGCTLSLSLVSLASSQQATDGTVPAAQAPVPAPGAPAAPQAAVAVRGERPRVVRAVQTLADWVRGRGGSVSVKVLDTKSASVWAEASPELALNPASNMKVVTAAVALDRLGAEYRFSTGLYGKLEGGGVESLVLRGHGDPSLDSSDLWQLAEALARLGVERVGSILVDQSRFDAQFVPPAFEQQPHEWARFRAPVSAVALNQNAVTLSVLPTTKGQPARAWFEPAGVVSVEGLVETRAPGSGEGITLSLRSEGDRLIARLGGHVAQGLPRLRFDKRTDDPRRVPGLALRELLREAGVSVPADVALGGEGVTQRLVFHQSEPLAALIVELGKNSDNFYAEMLFKVLGAEAGAAKASSADGARVVTSWLQSRGLLTPGTRIENGSGLFDANRVSAATLAGVLAQLQKDPRLFPEFLAHLAIGGVDGTLRSRFKALRESRRIRAKTGTLASAVGLSGYVLDTSGAPPVAFALLANGIEGHAAEVRQHIDRVVEAVAREE
jgi:D-alanyl-D-alanine carboxypeptidase/D-alanyl-D-alanine-endopeptidase (penicillin-binding protein 4)